MIKKVPFINIRSIWHEQQTAVQAAIADLVDGGVMMQGAEVSRFAGAFAHYLNMPYSVSCANGTDALFLILKAMGVKSGDEVIVPALTWFSNAAVVSSCGARVVFADIDEYYTLDSTHVSSLINSKTKAIVAVHLFGQIAEISAYPAGLLVEDVAQAHGASFKGKQAGTFGVASAFSFYPTKNLGAWGDAGMVLTGDAQLYKRVKCLAAQGQLSPNEHIAVGINSRMDEIQAIVLQYGLPMLQRWNERRRKFASIYHAGLADLPICLPQTRMGNVHVYHQYVIKTDLRDDLAGYLGSKGISTKIHYPTIIPLQKAYSTQKHKKQDFPKAYELSRMALSLPIHPGLEESQINFVIDQIQSFFR